MFTGLIAAKNAGWREGMADPQVVVAMEGLRQVKYLNAPPCPYKGWWNWLRAANWHSGYMEGVHESIKRWLGKRGEHDTF